MPNLVIKHAFDVAISAIVASVTHADGWHPPAVRRDIAARVCFPFSAPKRMPTEVEAAPPRMPATSCSRHAQAATSPMSSSLSPFPLPLLNPAVSVLTGAPADPADQDKDACDHCQVGTPRPCRRHLWPARQAGQILSVAVHSAHTGLEQSHRRRASHHAPLGRPGCVFGVSASPGPVPRSWRSAPRRQSWPRPFFFSLCHSTSPSARFLSRHRAGPRHPVKRAPRRRASGAWRQAVPR